MTKARRIGLVTLLLASGFSVIVALSLQRTHHEGIVDFRIVYLASRCMIEHQDPYSETEYLRVFREEGGIIPADPAERQKFEGAVMAVVYLPTALLVIAPFAALGWGMAQAMWTIVTIGLFTLACCLIWSVVADVSPAVSALLVGFMLANAEVVYAFGNAAGVAVSLCAIAVWCFFTERYSIAGVACLALSLAIKPHDSAAVWLYFVIAGGTYRRRAVQSLIAVIGLGIVAAIWMQQISPHWVQELRSNLAIVSARGGVADPGPAGMSNGTGGMIINLQTVFSAFRDDPRFYNVATWVVCAPLWTAWFIRTLRTKSLQMEIWLALAALIPLSLLPIYHRPYDAKVLLLSVPACIALWKQDGKRRWFGLLISSASIVVTSDLSSAMLTNFSRRMLVDSTDLSSKIVKVFATRLAPLILFVMSLFYLWAYVRRPSSTIAERV